ncbi:MAG TPA: CARDB domain-containing protein [Candidatus Thermoplasmatota archaeon]|nr:CARDB domain-containing protein [Candidatus Thermoplasmatota archaeon]
MEINVTDDIRYAVDDIRLQGWTGTAWEDVVAWYGPQKKTGDWYIEDLYNLALRRIGQPDAVPIPNTCVGNTNICTSVLVGQIRNTDTLIQGSGLGTRDERYGWEVVAGSPFDIEAFNPWHVSTDYADRPVFAANNEFYKPNWAEPREPRLMSNWDARLVSPVIDLGDAYDPVVAWRHLYSFRTAVTPSRDKVQAADGGFVEVQYTMKGEECGSTNPETTCWSAFFPVKVDGFARGYPNKNQVGFRDVGTYVDETFLSTQHIHTNAYPPVRGRIGNEKSFWGSIALPDATGRITDTRLTEKYVPASVTLANVECTPSQLQQMRSDHTKRFDCLPHNVTGRQIRVAFHLMTAGNYAHVTNGANISNGSYVPETYFNATTSDTLRSFPGEGWYITDFRVLGARQLGIDLAAKNLTFRVGYDVATIGVGPGTRVPINVTVENRGVFDALGYTGRLEVRRVLDRITQRTEVVDVIQLPQQPVLDKGKSVNHTLFWNVPATEGAEYALTFEVIPIGIPRDEDHLDNTQRLGTIALPIPAKTVRQFKIEFLVSPENATADITRYLPMFINNTGNVPLDGFTVERRITAIGRNVVGDAQTCAGWQARVAAGLQTAIVDCRQWTTQRPAAAGVLTPLTIISDDVSPTTDLFWKAPERATFLVSLTARTTQAGAELVSSAERRVAAFATYLFDDVEGGPRGDAMSGQWVFGPGWNVSQPGFRSTDSYAFGDLALGRYPADTDGQLLAPVIDLGSARTATLAFYTNFAFEPGFDGAVIEASDDGGISWTPLVPLDKPGISASYNKSYPMQAASSIHRTGDPEKVSTAFTHRSSNLPGSVDGWVLSQVELTNYANVTETDVEYEAYHAAELSRYARPPSLPTAAPNLYYAPDWCPGDPADGRCWMVQNMTQGIKAPTAAPGQADNTFWWSGSAARFDDHMRPVQNHLLEFEIDLAGVTAGQTVQAEWWEYQSRFNARSYYLDTSDPNVGRTLTAPGIYTVHTFHPGGVGSDNYRFNLGEPKVVESRGKWYRMQADLTPILERLDGAGTRTLTVGFAYTPVQDYHNDLTCTPAACTMPASLSWNALQNSTETSGTVYIDRSANDRGFAIDGFKVDVFRVTRGAEGPRTTIFRESDIVAKIEAGQGGIRECGIGKPDRDQGGTASRWSDGTPSYVGCLDNNAQVIRRAPLSLEEGRNWAIVTEIPGVDSSWRPVQVRDPKGYSNRTGEQLPTGDIPHAWYTGDLLCREDPEQRGRAHAEVEPFCPNLHSQARLITPVFDLARVAGDNAQLAFWHRFAFHQRNVSNTPLASGGVVEISVFDAQTGQWSDWQQMYATKDMRIGDSLTPVRDGTRGGYTGYTANVSKAADGQRRYDPPFHNVFSPDRDTPVQFLYTGNSKSIEENSGAPDGLVDGWLREEFDVSDYIGRKVRFGFHYAFSPALSQTSIQLSNPDQRPNAPGDGSFDRTGWWISDVSIIGDVLVGKPVQLRVRAGTDANVHDGHLQIDDIGVFGARYRNNVGIFVDGSPDRFGAYANTTTTVPVTIRNLGDTVRRDLALEVRVVGQGITVSGNGPGGNATLDNGAFVLKGFTLGPGQSAVANITVRTPRQVVEGATNAKLVLQLREANPQSQTRPFGPILDNEVQGLLMREVDFRLQAKGEFQTIDAGIRQVTPSVGETIEYVLTARNPGHGPIELNVTCVAQTVTGYADLNHVTQGPTEHPRVAATYPCDISGKTQLASKEWTNLTFRATPTEAGFLSFAVKIAIVGGDNITIPAAGVPVGTPLLTFRETFNRPEVLSNFTGNGFEWSHTRGHRGTGALLLGINETLALADTTPYTEACGIGQPCIAATPPIDLHNYSASTPAYLSFYHLDRMARWDGAQVRAQVLQDEIRPNAVASWSKECVLTPVHGYEGRVREWPTVPADPANPNGQMIPGDDNPAFDRAPYTGPPGATPVGTTKIMETRQDFFITPGGVWQEDWQLAVFRLPATCQAADGSGQVSLLGRTVRFLFMMFPGEPMGPPGASINRGDGHGFLVDEISVGPLALEVRPASQHANLLDNTTKGFNVLLRNLGRMPDLVRLEYDAQNSSAPENSVVVPSETYLLMPGERRTVTVHVTLPRDPSLLPTEFTARVLARSVLDPNAAGASLLNLQFGPRQWAELGLSVQAPRGIVQEGMETFIPLTIENTGLVDSVASRVRIIDEWPGGRVEHTLDLPSMPSYAQAADEAMRVLEFRWRPEPGSVGPHTLTFEIDPDQLGEEYTRDNNVVQLVVPVSDLLIPDLHIANFTALSIRNAVGGTVTPGFDADVARYEVTAGEVVSFELRVANRGRAGATNVDVGAFIGALSLPAKTIPYIAPGSETVVTFNWLAQKGEHKIEFFVRTEQPELTRLNNNYPGTGVTLLTVKGYEIVVEIPPIDGLLEPASGARVPFRITNNGNAGEDLVLVAKTPPGMRIMLPREGFFLRAGESYDDVARLILEAEAVAGQQFISIDAIARENPMKVASGRAALGVLASYGGSVAGGYASGAPTELVVPVELVNEGNSLEPWNVTLTLPAGWTTKEPMPARVIVPAHDRATFRFHVTIPADTAPGDRVLAVKAVMPNGEAREGVARVGVMPLRAAAVTVSDEAPAPVRGELAVPIKVQNTGNVREPFSVLLVDAPPGLQMRVEPAEFLLAPGAIAEATLIVKPNATIEVGTYAVAGYTRFAGVVPQTREGLANVQTLRVPIVRQDLRVTALEYSPRADLDAGDRVTVRATVQNFGQAPLTDVPVHLFVNDVFHSEVLVPRILAGARLDVTFNWTATTGVHTLTAVVDPYADTVDAAREDNAVSVLVTVGVAASAGGVAAGRADAPFGGAWLVLAALAVGMLVTRQLGSWRRERR